MAEIAFLHEDGPDIVVEVDGVGQGRRVGLSAAQEAVDEEADRGQGDPDAGVEKGAHRHREIIFVKIPKIWG